METIKNIPAEEKVRQLAGQIEKTLLPLIDRDYVLYGLPYYTNIGDTLIWEGELAFLKKVPYRCLGVCGWDDYPKTPVPENVLILITGGGYFGDIWRKAWCNVMQGIENNKENRIIVLPASIYYEDEAVREQDARYLSDFSNLVICARDSMSFSLAQQYFRNEVLLVPDMAFCIPPSYLQQWTRPSNDFTLYLKRIDKELAHADTVIPEKKVDVHDWPTMESMTMGERWFGRIVSRTDGLRRRVTCMDKPLKCFKDRMYFHLYRRMMTSRGVAFVSGYRKVYTTRLHVMILSVLLQKEVHVIDNSYKKLSSFYHTWLEDCQGITIWKE